MIEKEDLHVEFDKCTHCNLWVVQVNKNCLPNANGKTTTGPIKIKLTSSPNNVINFLDYQKRKLQGNINLHCGHTKCV